MDTTLTRGLRAEHRALISEVSVIPALAESLGGEGPDEVLARLEAVVGVLRHHLAPHIDAEERVLYPAFERLAQLPGSTAAFGLDHQEIHRRIELLADGVTDLSGDSRVVAQRRALQEHLWGLWAILRLHLDKEEQVIFPSLDQHLTAAEAASLLREMKLPVPYPEGLNPTEVRLYDHLTKHLANESFVLGTYAHLAELSKGSYVGYLLELVIDDEHHHHRMFEHLLNTLRARGETAPGPLVPDIVPITETHGLRSTIERHLEFERSDRRDLDQLAMDLGELPESQLWSLLVELMTRDTDKHIRILEFISEHAPRVAPGSPRRREPDPSRIPDRLS